MVEPKVKMKVEEAPSTTVKPPARKLPALRIRSKTAGFRRAGRAWGTEAQDVPLSEFTKEQLAQLRAEANLVVVDCEIDAAAAESETPAE